MLTVEEKAKRDIQQDKEEGIATGRVMRMLTEEECIENEIEIYSVIKRICSNYQGEFRAKLDTKTNFIAFSRDLEKFKDYSLSFYIDEVYPKTIIWCSFVIKNYVDSKDLKNLNQNKEFNQVLEFMSKVESELSVIEF